MGFNKLQVDNLQSKVKEFSRPGRFLLALDGSSGTASTWVSSELKAMAAAHGISEQVLGQQISEQLMRDIVSPAIKKVSSEVKGQMGVIVDLSQIPFANRSNQHTLPKVSEGDQEIPFTTAVAQLGMPIFVKGDGDGIDTNHKVLHGGQYKHVWEILEQPDLIAGTKTHFLTDGKSQVAINQAAIAASRQAADAIAVGITPMPEPDIYSETSLDAEKTHNAYMKYYETLMGTLKTQFSDFDISQLGSLMGTKLGPIEDGEFTNGPADRQSEEAIKKAAEATAKLITEIKEKFNLGFYRMLTNGRPFGYMLQVVNETNKVLNPDTHLGTSFSSAIIQEVLREARPEFDSSTNTLKLINTGTAQDFLVEGLEASRQASAGELKAEDFPKIFANAA